MDFKLWINYSSLALFALIINFSFTFHLSSLTLLLISGGAKPAFIPFIWIIPPLTGMIIQPVVGYLSDKTTSPMGRRKPYILGWGLLAALSFILLPIKHSLIAIIFFTFLIDCSLNGSAETLRALTADSFKDDKLRIKAFAIFAFFSGLGGLIGAFLPQLTKNYYYPLISSDFPETIGTAYFFAGLCMFFTLIIFSFYQEDKNLLVFQKKLINQWGFFKRLRQILKEAEPNFFKILFLHSLSWLGIFIFWLYFSVFMEQQFYISSAGLNKEKTDFLSLDISFCFTIYQSTALLFTLVITFLSRFLKVEMIHAFALMLGGLGILLISSCGNKFSLILPCSFVGILWGSLLALPYAIILKFMPPLQVGVYLGIFNISVTLPQIISAVLSAIMYILFQQCAAIMLVISGLVIILSGFLWLMFYKNQQIIKSKSTIISVN